MLRALVVAWLIALSAHARAETVALLPLDGEKRLEIYGQPVASEIGRALQASGIDVVVVGAKMAVPDKAQLIVDGTIKAGKGDAITLSIRIRDPRNGTVLETLPGVASTLTTIDRAAADLSARIVPSVRSHLGARAVAQPQPTDKPAVEPRPQPAAPAAPRGPLILIAVSSPRPAVPALDLLAAATVGELPAWTMARRRDAKTIEPDKLARTIASATVAEAGAQLGIALDVLSFVVDPGQIPLARARVRVRISDGTAIKLERIVRTDTIVGDRDITEVELAARTAREVLAIVNAQLRRQIAGWR